jgi:hypothetical protein
MTPDRTDVVPCPVKSAFRKLAFCPVLALGPNPYTRAALAFLCLL